MILVSAHWSDFVLGEPKLGFVGMDCNVLGPERIVSGKKMFSKSYNFFTAISCCQFFYSKNSEFTRTRLGDKGLSQLR